MKHLYKIIIILALCMLPSCKIENVISKLYSVPSNENHRLHLEQEHDIIIGDSNKKIIFEASKKKSAEQGRENTLSGSDRCDYQVKVELNDIQREELMRILRANLMVPQSFKHPKVKPWVADGVKFRFYFYQNGKEVCLALEILKRANRNKNFEDSYFNINEAALRELELFAEQLDKLYCPQKGDTIRRTD